MTWKIAFDEHRSQQSHERYDMAAVPVAAHNVFATDSKRRSLGGRWFALATLTLLVATLRGAVNYRRRPAQSP